MAVNVLLTWTDTTSAEEGFKVYRSTSTMDPGSLPTPLATLSANVTSYLDTTAVASTLYYYRVASYIGALIKVSSEQSITSCAEDPPDICMLSVDEVDEGIDNNLLLSGDEQSGSDLLTI